MKTFFPLLLILGLGYVAGRPQEIPREFKNLNIENYLRNERAVKFQLKCVIYDGPCDTIGKYLKTNIPTWLKTQCENCNDETKGYARKLVEFFQTNYAKEWDDAIAKYKGSFTAEEEARFEKEVGIKIRRDPNAPTQKPDHKALAALAKEAKDALKTAKPIIISKDGTSTAVPAGDF